MLACGYGIFTAENGNCKRFFTAESAAAAENVNGNGIYRRVFTGCADPRTDETRGDKLLRVPAFEVGLAYWCTRTRRRV
jgi:hypothetical protein